MDTRNLVIRPLTGARATDITLCLLSAGVMLVLLHSFRVFMPYLVFEIDQSERTTLASIAVLVFALTFLGAVLFRLFGARVTLAIAVVGLAIGRLGFQFTEDPGARWKLGAATIVTCLWVLIVVLPSGGRSIGYGIGFAFLIDLILRALRGTLDLPWMPGIAEDVLTIAIVVAIALSAYGLTRSEGISSLEMPFGASIRYAGIGSGVALWLVVAGSPGFAEMQSELGLPGAFALLAIGTLLALVANVYLPNSGSKNQAGRLAPVALGLLAAIGVLVWTRDWSHWLDLLVVPIFAFAIVALTMLCASAPESLDVPGRWRTGAAVTIGVLLQAAFIFLYFARTGPMELYLAPLAILTVAAMLANRSAADTLPARLAMMRSVAATAIVAAVTFGWLLIDEPERSSVSAETAELTVMTFNIQEGFSNDNIWDLEATARTIESYDPDIVVLQEITRGWLVMSSVDQVRWLADRLDMNYAYSGNSYDGLWGNAILTRLPILSTDSVIYSSTDNLRRGAVAVEVQTSSGPLRVLDTHLDNPREATEVRLEQIEVLVTFLGTSTPAIVAGDFNADPGSPEWQAMIDAGLVDAAADDATTTSEDARRIDYIFLTPNLTVSSYDVPEIWTSDHRPVIVELSLSP